MQEIQGGLKPQSVVHPVPRRASLYAIGIHKLGGAKAGANKFFMLTHGEQTFGDPAKVRSDMILSKAKTGAFPSVYIDKRGVTEGVVKQVKGADKLLATIQKVLNMNADGSPKPIPTLPVRSQLETDVISRWDPLDPDTASTLYDLFEFSTDKLPSQMVLRRDGEEKIMDHIKGKFQGRGLYIFETQEATRIVMAEFQMKQAVQLFTRFVDDMLDMKPLETHWELVGLGQFVASEKLVKKRTPSMWVECMNGNFNGQIRINSRTMNIRNQFYTYAHLELLAQAIRMLGVFDDSTMKPSDYLAQAWWFVFSEWGALGENKAPEAISDASGESIYSSILTHMFNNTNMMWKYEIANTGEFLRYFIFEFIKAFVVLRLKAEALEVTVSRVKGAPLDNLHYWEASNTPDYRNVGSESLWLIPARNTPGAEIQLPVAVDQDNDNSFKNRFDRFDETVGDSFSTLTLINKSYPPGSFDPMDQKEVRCLLDVSQPELSIETIQLKRRNAMIFRFPRFLGLGLSEEANPYRKRDWLLSQYAGAGSYFKNGIVMDFIPDLVREPSWANVFENLAILQGKRQEVDTSIGKEGSTAVTPPPIVAESERTTPPSIPTKAEAASGKGDASAKVPPNPTEGPSKTGA